jgi:hypothetical protein
MQDGAMMLSASQGFAAAALVAAVISFGFAMWAATDGAPGWRSFASLVATGACVASLASAMGMAT